MNAEQQAKLDAALAEYKRIEAEILEDDMNDKQKLRLRVASEQMAAMQANPDRHDWSWKGLPECAVEAADALIAAIERTAKAADMPEGGVMDKFTVEQVSDAIKDLEEGRYCSGDSDVIGMLRAYAVRLWADALDTKILDFLDAHPELIVRSGKQAIRPLILAAMIEQGKGDESTSCS